MRPRLFLLVNSLLYALAPSSIISLRFGVPLTFWTLFHLCLRGTLVDGFFYNPLPPIQQSTCKPTYPAHLARRSVHSKYTTNRLSRVHDQGGFWRGTDKYRRTCDRLRECQTPM